MQDEVFASVRAKLFDVAKSSVLLVSDAAIEIAEMLPFAVSNVTRPVPLIENPPSVVEVCSTLLTLRIDISRGLYGPGGVCWIAGVSG